MKFIRGGSLKVSVILDFCTRVLLTLVSKIEGTAVCFNIPNSKFCLYNEKSLGSIYFFVGLRNFTKEFSYIWGLCFIFL
jgi:hypothetical protein